jgi:hypothetical protein
VLFRASIRQLPDIPGGRRHHDRAIFNRRDAAPTEEVTMAQVDFDVTGGASALPGTLHRVQLQPGDRIVLTCPGGLLPPEGERYRATLKGLFPDHKVLVLSGMQLGIVSGVATPKPAEPPEYVVSEDAPSADPTPMELCHELREAVELPTSALPMSPKQAWAEAVGRVREAVADMKATADRFRRNETAPPGHIAVPICLNFDTTRPIGRLTILSSFLPAKPDFVFAIGYEKRSFDGEETYRLAEVSLVSDSDYARVLQRNGIVATARQP